MAEQKPFDELLTEANLHRHCLDDVDDSNRQVVATELHLAADSIGAGCLSMSEFLNGLAEKVHGGLL